MAKKTATPAALKKPKSAFHQKIGRIGGARITRAKLQACRANGHFGGRPSLIPDTVWRAAAAEVLNGAKIPDVVRRYGIYKRKLYRYVVAARKQMQEPKKAPSN
jgi:hypothetical protein